MRARPSVLGLAAATLAALVSACHKPSSGTADPAPSASVALAPAPPGMVRLEDDSLLKLPEGAALLQQVPNPPPGALSSRLYRVPSVGAILTVTLQKPGPKDCEASLAEAQAQLDAQRADPAQQGLFRADVAERRAIGGHKAFYTETAMRSPDELKGNVPMHLAAAYLECTKTSTVRLTLSVLRAELPTRAKVELDQVATSLSP